ncbi:MAG: hypothetical protein K2K53_06085 [Oscillospiraceae bacterium]|nr:hypothetical protein [Oscillospiraceae bacterium]
MAEIKCVDHEGTEFPSFEAMCKKWWKNPDTVRKRLEMWTADIEYDGAPHKVPDNPLELALEIPEVPGYEFELAFINLFNKYYYNKKLEENNNSK